MKGGITKNFTTRMLVNALGIPAILILNRLGGLFFTCFVMLVAVIAQIELYSLSKKKGIFPDVFPGIAAGIIWIVSSLLIPEYLIYLLLFILIVLLIINLFRQITGSMLNVSITIFGFLYFPVLLSTMILLRELPTKYDLCYREGERLVLLLFVSVWICDSLAFVFGKLMGKSKIAPKVSPNKTVVGCIFGFVGALLAVILLYLLGWTPVSLTFLHILFFGLLAGLFSQVGDFVESIFKRDIDVKDSGTILLGHGGVMDRFDAFFIAAPVIYMYVYLILHFGV